MEDDHKTEMIPVPEDIEARLLEIIDTWDRQERARKRIVAAAAFLCLFLAAGITFRIHSAPEPSARENISDPVLACQEAGKALELLVENLERGLSLIDYTRMHE